MSFRRSLGFFHAFGLRKWLINRFFLARKRYSSTHYLGGLSIEPMAKCNLRCPLCPCPPWVTDRREAVLDFEDFKRIIDQSHRLVPRYNLYFAGEPLMHPRIVDMARYINDHDRLIWLSSNASFLTEEVAEGLIDAHVDNLWLTIDGLDQENHAFYRRSSDFDQVFKNILRFIEIKQKKRSRHPYLEILTMSHAMNHNKKEEYQRFWKQYEGKYGVNNFLMYDLNLNVFKRKDGKTPDELKQFLPPLEHSRYEKVGNGNVVPRKVRDTCPDPRFPVIAATGEMFVCCQDPYGRHPLGNVLQDGFEKVWFSDHAVEMRNKAANLQFDMCSSCNWRGM